MNEEEIVYPQMPDWRNLLSPELLLVYVASTLGELSINKETRTITMNTPYQYEPDFLDTWQSIIDNYRQQYLQDCPDNEGAANDLQLFKEFDNLISVLRQELL